MKTTQIKQDTAAHPLRLWRKLGLASLALATAFLASACSERGNKDEAGQEATVKSAEAAVEPATQSDSLSLPRTQEQDETAVTADSLLPDVSAFAADTLTYPGGTVEITARTSSDVTAVSLWDGIGQKQAFTCDAEAKVWRVTYRVPLKPLWERLGLSVTARNSAKKWRRVWVFLQIQGQAPQAQAAPVEK
jgi:hypothetical protein